jgi:PST family polysaccharide transporter
VISPVVADRIFHDPRVALVLQVMAAQVAISAATSVHTALLQKEMQFKQLFWIRLLTVTLPGLVSIPLAIQGMGYWALVVGTLVGQLAQAVVLWRVSQWRPSARCDIAAARRLLRFGSWVAVSGLLAWFYVWADSLFVGMYLGAHELGLYRTGNTFVMMVFGVLFAPLLPVLYSHLARIQADRPRITQLLAVVVRLITFVAVPTGFLLYAFAEQLGLVVFGVNWQGISLVIGVMGLTQGFAWIVGTNGEAYRATGRPNYETATMASTLLIYVFAYWLSIQHGLEVFLWTRLSVALVAIGIHLMVARVALALPIWRTLLYIVRVSLVGIPLILLERYWHDVMDRGALHTVLLVMTALSCVVGYLWLLERKSLIPETLRLLRGAVSR